MVSLLGLRRLTKVSTFRSSDKVLFCMMGHAIYKDKRAREVILKFNPLLTWYHLARASGEKSFSNKMRLWYTNAPPPPWPFFPTLWPWYLTLTLTDDFDFGTKERVLPQGIYIWNIWKLYHLPFKSYGQCKSFLWTNKQTGQKLYAPNLLMQGHKNCRKRQKCWFFFLFLQRSSPHHKNIYTLWTTKWMLLKL